MLERCGNGLGRVCDVGMRFAQGVCGGDEGVLVLDGDGREWCG